MAQEIARQGQLEAAAHRDAVDSCDDRLVQVEARGHAGESAGREMPYTAFGVGLEVVSGGERAMG